MQAVTSSQPEAQPVLLWVDRDAGHGQGKPLNLRIRDAADQRLFIMWQLGMLPIKPTELPPVSSSGQKSSMGYHGTKAAPVAASNTVATTTSAVALTPVHLKVEGMHCELCAGKVRAALKKVKGVKDVDVKLDTASAEVTLDESAPASTQDLLAAFEKSDFKVTAADSK